MSQKEETYNDKQHLRRRHHHHHRCSGSLNAKFLIRLKLKMPIRIQILLSSSLGFIAAFSIDMELWFYTIVSLIKMLLSRFVIYLIDETVANNDWDVGDSD
ncbi:hypothetical protein DERP_010976 [Dermatophagoides pteronyssinus]|uniref:Uncharacterized protein n=1 Tax=Dermatophagoides pteronyssinus TaxID=6956 RepID=A0ABQ8JVH1_DERPT|nr:hypothetical protein DERP_010976 [Dermatophagoides pteronyssinus]